MSNYFVLLLAVLSVLCHGAHADCANVTITNAADADAARKNCRVIQGDLILGHGLSESINLDGIEVVEGDIQHSGCERQCSIPEPFSISSSTLTTVNGSIKFWFFQGLDQIVLPKLTTVNQSILFERLDNVTHIDITALAHIGYFVLETPALKTLLLDGLQGFTGAEGNGGVEIREGGSVKSFDGFFKNPLDPEFNPGNWFESSLYTSSLAIPNVRKLTVGWTKLSTLSIGGVNLTLVLGGSSTTSMEIESLNLRDGVVGLERSPALKNLSVTNFDMESNQAMTDLSVPFNQLTNFSLSGANSLRTLEFPPEAVDWRNLSLVITSCPALNLSSEYTVKSSGERQQTWYWPQKDMAKIKIYGNVSNDFFQSFIDYRNQTQDSSNRPRVLETFDVQDYSSKLKCSIFDQLKNDTGVLPTNFLCQQKGSTSQASQSLISMVQQPWKLGLLALVSFSFFL